MDSLFDIIFLIFSVLVHVDLLQCMTRISQCVVNVVWFYIPWFSGTADWYKGCPKFFDIKKSERQEVQSFRDISLLSSYWELPPFWYWTKTFGQWTVEQLYPQVFNPNFQHRFQTLCSRGDYSHICSVFCSFSLTDIVYFIFADT